MKKIVLFFAIVGMLFMSSCQRHSTDECEDIVTHVWLLPKALNQYLPYEVGQQLTFTNELPDGLGDTVVYEVYDVLLLKYDTAYVTTSYNPCYPTGLLPSYGVQMRRVSEQAGDETPARIGLWFSGSASGENGQNVRVMFVMLADYDNHQGQVSSEEFIGDISNMEDVIRLNKKLDNYLSYAEIIKGKGLKGFTDYRNGIITWMLLE